MDNYEYIIYCQKAIDYIGIKIKVDNKSLDLN
jgi:hypothetical protein